MQTQLEATLHAPTVAAEPPAKRVPGRGRIHVALNISKAEYRRMRLRAAREKLSFGQWVERAIVKEMRRAPSI